MSIRLYEIGDIPLPADMANYLDLVRRVWEPLPGTPALPADMNRLNYQGANEIERSLEEADGLLERTKLSWIYSGEMETGGF